MHVIAEKSRKGASKLQAVVDPRQALRRAGPIASQPPSLARRPARLTFHSHLHVSEFGAALQPVDTLEAQGVPRDIYTGERKRVRGEHKFKNLALRIPTHLSI